MNTNNTNPPTLEADKTLQEALAKSQEEASIVENYFPAAQLMAVAGTTIGSKVSTLGYKTFLDRLLKASGSPTNPIEIMMTQQLAQAHYRIADLHAQSACAKAPDLAVAMNAAAVKLIGEFRKTALALRELRNPVTPTQVTVVKQQNLAAGNQNVALIDGKVSSDAESIKTDDIELVSNQTRLNHVELNTPIPATDCWEAEPLEAKRVNIRRSREAQAGGVD